MIQGQVVVLWLRLLCLTWLTEWFISQTWWLEKHLRCMCVHSHNSNSHDQWRRIDWSMTLPHGCVDTFKRESLRCGDMCWANTTCSFGVWQNLVTCLSLTLAADRARVEITRGVPTDTSDGLQETSWPQLVKSNPCSATERFFSLLWVWWYTPYREVL